MKIKSAKSFRNWYKNLTPARRNANQYWDENFIGAQHNELSGFFTMYHGDKTKVYDFLRKEVEMAEDGQAIYEFVQNAADSNSTLFNMFYDENYLAVINNGDVFSKEGIKSILNIGQSYGKEDPDKIGRYGIGFKLVHRLVGKSSGLDELLNKDNEGYRGPLLFSWSERQQFENFLSTKEFDYVNFEDTSAPWLLKILITNFPAQPEENVKDISYQDIEPFSIDELQDFQAFLLSCYDKIDVDNLDSGTIFFLKLGEGKFDYLERQKQEYLNGLSTSMHFLKSLKTLTVNDTMISKDQNAAKWIDVVIPNGSEEFKSIGLTEVRDQDSDAKFKICYGHNTITASEIKKHPNIYKYFPAVKEVNNLSFVIHSNLFELSSNRQNLTETPVNKNLLTLLSKELETKMDVFKVNNRESFKNLFLSILMSDTPSGSSGNGWQNEYFYKNLLAYIKQNIPTKNGYCKNPDYVIINKLNIVLNLADFGLSHFEWFEWENQEDQMLINEALNSEKLGLKSWDIRDIIEQANLESVNNWIKSAAPETYKAFLKELEASQIRRLTGEKLSQIKLFKFSNGEFFAFNDVVTQRSNLGKTSFKFTNYFFSNRKTAEIKNELIKIEMVVSEICIEEYPNIFSSMTQPEDKMYYVSIAEKCKSNTLSSSEKERLFKNLINEKTKFDNVGNESFKELCLFFDANNEIQPLSKLIDQHATVPLWLNDFKIKKEEYFSELQPFLISEPEDLFNEIYQPNKDDIVSRLTEASEIKTLIKLYKDNQEEFFKEFIIVATENGFSLKEKTSETYQVQSPDKEVREFIEKNCLSNLFVLPQEFVAHRDDEGIAKLDVLHTLILEFVDVDEYKEDLVKILKYTAKFKFLQSLSEIKFNSNKLYTIEDYEYEILNLACKEYNDSNSQNFRDRVIIENGDITLKLSDIPPFTDDISINGKTLKLSDILPDIYKNSSILKGLLDKFLDLGLPEDKLLALFGIDEETNYQDIFQLLTNNYEVLQDEHQLAFVLLYGLYIEDIDFSLINVLNTNEEVTTLECDKYLVANSFIDQEEILHSKYSSVTKYFNDFPIKIGYASNLLIMEEPYFEKGNFRCSYLLEELNEEQKLCLVKYLFKTWNEDKESFKEVDWSKINNKSTEKVLGFMPKHAVYPNKYARKEEQLPAFITDWIAGDKHEISFIQDFGVWTEKSVLVDLRKFLMGETREFKNSRIPQETRFNDDEQVLFDTFEWLKEKGIELSTEEQFETFNKMITTINENRTNYGDLVIEDNVDKKFDIDRLKENSSEWKVINDFSICLYNGQMPVTVRLDEIDDYVFYRYDDEDYAVDNNSIYINENADKKDVLQLVASVKENKFSFEELWQLFGNHSGEAEELKKEIDTLKDVIKHGSGAMLGSAVDGSLSKNDQIEANNEAKEIVKERLEQEGYKFTMGLNGYSTVDGVFKNGNEFPLVVKSYAWNKEPFKVGANEWIQLMKPNSMFWVHFGGRKLGCIKLNELLRKQDKMTISFSTENLDFENRLENFAELLHYFSGVHFNFDSLVAENYSVAEDLEDYSFSSRKVEDDLSSDDESLL
ncbi:sacsin N-terminal ATP-binding-like domain-containing protein [Aestuariibaculum marinum]|uniref:Protein NO VEIN C-terminal domain-containing protein n=1 Tax=Aestuariibaculum marinum TaxID=2683592 RepID=A0A8J6QBC4_9FLAO|nr:hypothetical protein [Aestuariibaculum marinum]MBD0824436.1 hypothetical protein [Aestuariibaculum marinum]